MYQIYRKWCQDNMLKPSGRMKFTEILKDMNVAIHNPRKDQCDVCIGHDLKLVSDEEHAAHVQRKDEGRKKKLVERTRG